MLTDHGLGRIEQRLRMAPDPLAEYQQLPLLYDYLAGGGCFGPGPGPWFAEFDAAIDRVLQHTREDRRKDVLAFLRADASQWREWYGGLLDLWIRGIVLMRSGPDDVEFDSPLPNGGDTDVRLRLGGRHIRLESTALLRDGQHAYAISQRNWWPTIYLYLTVYDKLPPALNLGRSQCAEAEPNVLLICRAGAVLKDLHILAGCRLLFSAHVEESVPTGETREERITDLALPYCLERHASDLIESGKLRREDFDRNRPALLDARRQISGVIIFRSYGGYGFTLQNAVRNEHALDPCRLSDEEWEALLGLLCESD